MPAKAAKLPRESPATKARVNSRKTSRVRPRKAASPTVQTKLSKSDQCLALPRQAKGAKVQRCPI